MLRNNLRSITKNFLIVSLVLVIYASGCATVEDPSSTPALNTLKTFTPSVDSFQINDTCPDICWLGIKPGITSREEALRLIRGSDQFVQQFTRQTDNAIEAYWYTETTKDYKANIYIALSKDTVKSITISNIEPFTVDDFVRLLGTPTGIRFRFGKYPYEGGEYTLYSLYYSLFNAVLTVKFPEVHEPKPDDFVDILELNPDLDSQSFQPWLGYRSLEEYFPDGIPTAIPPNTFENNFIMPEKPIRTIYEKRKDAW